MHADSDGHSNTHRNAWAEDLISEGDITFARAQHLRVVSMEAQRAVPLATIVRGRSLGFSRRPALATDPAQVRLGQALAARVTEITRLTGAAAAATGLTEPTSTRFAKQIRDVHALTSRAIARFLISGQGTTETERNFISRVGVIAARYGLSLGVLAQSYVLWRDTNLRVLNEEVDRLRVGRAVSSLARKIIRSSADTGLRRMARAYEYQMHVARCPEQSVEELAPR
ncbi:MAG: hypothetical protein ACYDA0_05600 [Candidatus Dormibacteraceae bacterium]